MPAADQLARLVAVLDSSAVMYLVDCGLSTYPGPDDVRLAIGDLAASHAGIRARAEAVLEDPVVVAIARVVVAVTAVTTAVTARTTTARTTTVSHHVSRMYRRGPSTG